MDLSDPKLIELLRQMTVKAQEFELNARLTGENFNVFKILGQSTAEVRHSAFIAELLNPQGSHNQGDTYLALFLKRFPKLSNFLSVGAAAEVEHFIGSVSTDSSEGGRIDIVLWDAGHKARVLIENKIYAGDGYKQLLRYHKAYPEADLIYLTLDGGNPNLNSTGGSELEDSLKQHGSSLLLMSYKNDIVDWLEDCHKASVSLPVVRETIVQYKHLVRELTNQATGDKVNEEAKKLIIAHPELIDAAGSLWTAWQGIVWQANNDFRKQTKGVDDYSPLVEDVMLRMFMPDDCGGMVVAFRAYKGNDVPAEDYKRYASILRSIVAEGRLVETKSYDKSNYWNVGWFVPNGFKSGGGFESLSKSQILAFQDNETLSKFANEVVQQANAVRNELRAKIKTA